MTHFKRVLTYFRFFFRLNMNKVFNMISKVANAFLSQMQILSLCHAPVTYVCAHILFGSNGNRPLLQCQGCRIASVPPIELWTLYCVLGFSEKVIISITKEDNLNLTEAVTSLPSFSSVENRFHTCKISSYAGRSNVMLCMWEDRQLIQASTHEEPCSRPSSKT